MKVISYGGGVQSTAMLVLANQGVIQDVDAALFSNVGNDSEHPATLEYVRDVAMQRSKIPVHELQPIIKGKPITLWQLLHSENTPSIPVRLEGGAPAQRSCTRLFKARVVEKWLKDHRITSKNPATVCIGISTDEIQRVNPNRSSKFETPIYPLIDLGLDRSGCVQVIQDYGWPIPPKSSCFFCPFHRPQQWSEMRRDEPELFARAVELEKMINVKRAERGKDSVYLTRLGKPLDQAIDEAQDTLPLIEWDSCDSGHCMT